MRWASAVVLLLLGLGCIKVAVEQKTEPSRPTLKTGSVGSCGALPCSLCVLGSDPGGEVLSYQFLIEDLSASGRAERTPWSDFTPSGQERWFPLAYLGHDFHSGLYYVRVRSRNIWNRESTFSDRITLGSE